MVLQEIQDTFGGAVLETRKRSDRRSTLTIGADSLLPMAEYLFRDQGFRFIIASALHTPKGFEIYYHFSLDPQGWILNLHVILEGEDPKIESLSNMFEASNWIEREMHELFGIEFLHHPEPEALLSEGNWATGEYPYRKEFPKGKEKAQ